MANGNLHFYVKVINVEYYEEEEKLNFYVTIRSSSSSSSSQSILSNSSSSSSSSSSLSSSSSESYSSSSSSSSLSSSSSSSSLSSSSQSSSSESVSISWSAAFEDEKYWIDNAQAGGFNIWNPYPYLYNPQNSTTLQDAYTSASIGPYNDFDIKVDIRQATNAGSRSDLYVFWFTDFQGLPVDGPFFITELHSYSANTDYDYFLFNVRNKDNTNIYNSGELRKYDYSNSINFRFTVRVRKRGNDWYCKIWREDESEPDSWDVTTTIPPSSYIDNDDEFHGPIYIRSNGLSIWDNFSFIGS